jgi:hypothetical protein
MEWRSIISTSKEKFSSIFPRQITSIAFKACGRLPLEESFFLNEVFPIILPTMANHGYPLKEVRFMANNAIRFDAFTTRRLYKSFPKLSSLHVRFRDESLNLNIFLRFVNDFKELKKLVMCARNSGLSSWKLPKELLPQSLEALHICTPPTGEAVEESLSVNARNYRYFDFIQPSVTITLEYLAEAANEKNLLHLRAQLGSQQHLMHLSLDAYSTSLLIFFFGKI